jgi:flagellar hook-basal body complex protein FliE
MIPSIGVGPLGASEWSVGAVPGLSSVLGSDSGASQTGSTEPTASGTGSFANALTHAIGALDTSQNTAAVDSEQLATGQATDPTQAVTAVENASLSMDFASQIRNQLDSAAQTVFQTQM